jgi:hypothetical protein
LRALLFRVLAFGGLFAVVEAYFLGPVRPVYHLVYYLMFIAVFFDPKIRVWAFSAIASMTLEDGAYWVLTWTAPFSWSPAYPVVAHVPLLYLPAVSIVALTGRRLARWTS